jgi:hypothetical protein
MYTLLPAAIFDHSSNKEKTPPQSCSGILHGKSLRNLLYRFEWGKDPKLGLLRRADGGKEMQKGADGTSAALMNTQTAVEAVGVIEDAFVTRLAKALAISLEDLDVVQPMHAYGGMSSLLSEGLKNIVTTQINGLSRRRRGTKLVNEGTPNKHLCSRHFVYDSGLTIVGQDR